MPVNALDSLTAPERTAVVNRTLTTNISTGLKDATHLAISQNEALYLPAGLWLIKADLSWDIDIDNNKSLTIYGDGDGTEIRRMDTTSAGPILPMVRIAANDKINLTFQNLLFDGNEANCSTASAAEHLGDGVKTEFAYSVNDAKQDSLTYVTFVENGIEKIQNRGGFKKNRNYPNPLVIFRDAPPVGTTVRIYNIFYYEQSANVKFATGKGVPDTITFTNVAMTGCVGDGFHANVPFQRLHVTNWRSYGRTRRPRADIQLSRIPLQETNITNFEGDAFESEPSEVNAEHVINLSNMVVRGAFDLAGDKGKHRDGRRPNFVNVNAQNIEHFAQKGIGLPFSNFFRVRGQFVNCSFASTDQIRRCQITFRDGKFSVPLPKDDDDFAKPIPKKADPILIMHDKPNAFVEFENVSFDHDEDVVGGYFVRATGTSDVNRITRFINCRNLQQLEYFAFANRCGTMLFDGGQLSGTKAAISIANGGGENCEGMPYITKVILKNSQQWLPSLIDIDVVGGPTQIEMDGTFNAEAVKPVANNRALENEYITWMGSFTGSVLSDPNGRIRGLPGLVLRDVGAAAEWRYRHTNMFASTEYDLIT